MGKQKKYSQTSRYGHLSITDSSFGPRNAKYGQLCKVDTWFCPFDVRIKEVWLYGGDGVGKTIEMWWWWRLWRETIEMWW